MMFYIGIGIGCVLLVAAGVVAGYALCARRCENLAVKLEHTRDELAMAAAECTTFRKRHDTLVEECRTVHEANTTLRTMCARLEQDLKEQKKAADAGFKIVSNYEMAAFEYARTVERVTMLEKENRVFSMQVAVQRKRIDELNGVAVLAERYKETRLYADACTVRIKKLEDEVHALKTQGVKPPTARTRFKDASGQGSLAQICSRILDTAALSSSNCGAVIADDMGFPIVSSSEYTDELAGVSVLHGYCSSILEKTIAFGNIARITFKNTGNMFCTIVPFVVNGQTVYYAGLSDGEMVSKKPVRAVTDAVLVR